MNEFDDFDTGNYPSREENQEFVRKMMERKGYKLDSREVVLRLQKSSVNILFRVIMRQEGYHA
jgi:hypothetical protein